MSGNGGDSRKGVEEMGETEEWGDLYNTCARPGRLLTRDHWIKYIRTGSARVHSKLGTNIRNILTYQNIVKSD